MNFLLKINDIAKKKMKKDKLQKKITKFKKKLKIVRTQEFLYLFLAILVYVILLKMAIILIN